MGHKHFKKIFFLLQNIQIGKKEKKFILLQKPPWVNELLNKTERILQQHFLRGVWAACWVPGCEGDTQPTTIAFGQRVYTPQPCKPLEPTLTCLHQDECWDRAKTALSSSAPSAQVELHGGTILQQVPNNKNNTFFPYAFFFHLHSNNSALFSPTLVLQRCRKPRFAQTFPSRNYT